MAISKKQVQAQMRAGGQRVFQNAYAEIYDKEGPRLERQSGAGMTTKVHQLLDPRLDITQSQRAIGNCFGALCQEVISGGRGGSFLKERVDSSPTGAGGYSEAHAHRSLMVSCALKALRSVPSFTYPKGKGRNCVLGPHKRIKAFDLAFQVCVKQRTLSLVALSYGWTRTPVRDGKPGKPVVPDRQRKALAGHLRTTIDTIADAWVEGEYKVPYEFFTVVPR
ncbi:hypothetical protein NBRC116590_02890 [Pelagimonas sp. KU-00592-HH]|uniref:hypothetical protein n=1 Tax=Pelagimonas sp. KU-00592-HH TaxID=3127651 RepID=UPI003101E099